MKTSMPKRKASAAGPRAATSKRARKPEEESNPFPDWNRPSADECQAARDGLARLHGEPKQAVLTEEQAKLAQPQAEADAEAQELHSHDQITVLDSLVRTILSQNTTDVNSRRSFAALKKAFPTWIEVLKAEDADVEVPIKSGGLAAIKTQRIKLILQVLKEERGECSMEYLRKLNDEEIKTELTRFKGVGKKTVACVLMFCLDRHEFPVDTHVWRITKSLGWVPQKASRDQTYAHLNARVPDNIKYDLHVLLVEHGKCCERCAKNNRPRKEGLGVCPLFGQHSVFQQLQHSPRVKAYDTSDASDED